MPSPPSQSPTAKSWALLVTLALIWGGSFMAISIALVDVGPLVISAARITLGAVAILFIAWISGIRLPDRASPAGGRIWVHAIGMGLFSNALPFTLLGWAQQQVTSGFAGITMAGVPLLVLPLAHLFVPGERMSTKKGLGFAVGFVGVVVLIGPASLIAGAEGGPALARAACLAAAACYAIGSIVTRLAPQGPLLSFSAAALLAATVFIVPTAILIEGIPSQIGAPALLAMGYLGLMPTALATLMLVQVIKTAGPSFLSLVNYQVPVWAVLMGAVFLGEAVPPQTLGALALILTGLVLAQGRIPRRRAR